MSEGSSLTQKRCAPCAIGTPALATEDQHALLAELGGAWRIVDGHHLEQVYRFEDFKQALAFTNQVGQLAESLGHHPEIRLGWGRVGISIWTHKIDGLTEADFVLAAKIGALGD